MPTESIRDKLLSVAKGAAIAAAGAALAYLAGQGAIGAAVAAVIVNVVRKFWPDLAKLAGLGVLALAILPVNAQAQGALPGDLTLTLSDGRSALLRAPPGTYALYPGETLGAWTVTLGGGPGPVPNPDPPTPTPPTPNPPTPTPPAPQPPGPSPLGISRIVWDLVQPLPAPAKSRAPAVAAAFDALASRIASGTLSQLQVPGATRAALDAAVGDQSPAWAPIDKAIQNELRRLAGEGRLTSLSDLADAYRELAAGLGAVR